MQFDSWSAFMAMDGHGVYVWSVYGAALVILLLLAINPLLKNRRFFQEQAMRLRREQMLRERKIEQQATASAANTDK